MAELEFVGFDSTGKELEAPQGADTYIAKKAAKFEQPVTLDSTMAGRNIAADGTKLDLITVTAAVDLDAIAAAQGPGAVILMPGGWDASTGLFPESTLTGETWVCAVAGITGGIQFELNDRVTALVDGASTTVYVGNWIRAQYADLVTSVAGKQGAVILEKSDITDLPTYMLPADIDSLAKLNALVLDATLGDASAFATAAQGALAATALQSASISSIASLNSLVLDATLDDSSASRTPLAHTHTQSDITDLADPAVTPVSTSLYNVVDGDSILHVTYTSTGAVTSLTLMNDQAVDGRRLIIKDAGGNSAVNNITVDTEGSQTIDGSATKVMSVNYESVTLYCDGLNWFII